MKYESNLHFFLQNHLLHEAPQVVGPQITQARLLQPQARVKKSFSPDFVRVCVKVDATVNEEFFSGPSKSMRHVNDQTIALNCFFFSV